MYDYQIIRVHNDRAQILPLCDTAAEFIGVFESVAVWVTADQLAYMHGSGFRFC